MLKQSLAQGRARAHECSQTKTVAIAMLELPVRWNHTSYHACHIRSHTTPRALP
jgi:hypothetical protein